MSVQKVQKLHTLDMEKPRLSMKLLWRLALEYQKKGNSTMGIETEGVGNFLIFVAEKLKKL